MKKNYTLEELETILRISGILFVADPEDYGNRTLALENKTYDEHAKTLFINCASIAEIKSYAISMQWEALSLTTMERINILINRHKKNRIPITHMKIGDIGFVETASMVLIKKPDGYFIPSNQKTITDNRFDSYYVELIGKAL